MIPWPILSPSRDDGHACPDWCRLTSARCRGPLGQGSAADPELDERREAAAVAREQARMAATEARQREREAARAIRLAEGQRKREEDRLARAEASQRRLADRQARELLSAEERSRRIREGLERARAEGRMRTAKPKPPAPVVPEGYVRISLAAKAVGRSRPCLDRAVRRGRLASELIRGRLYVKLEGAREYVVWADAERIGAAAKARAAYSAKAAARRVKQGERPWAKLCPRNRGRPKKTIISNS